MPQTPYFVVTVPLDNVINLGSPASRIAPKGMRVTDVGVLFVSTGAAGAVRLHLGQKGDPIPLRLIGQNFHMASPEDTGIWVTVPVAAPGESAELLIGLADEVRADA